MMELAPRRAEIGFAIASRFARLTALRRLVATIGLVASACGCHAQLEHSPSCAPAGIGFTPTRWTCWQDGPMAYRLCPQVSHPVLPAGNGGGDERRVTPHPGIPEIIPPPANEEGLPLPPKLPQRDPHGAAGSGASVRPDRDRQQARSLSYDASSNNATNSPASASSSATVYTWATMAGAAGVADTSDNDHSANVTSSFTTEVAGPAILSIAPANSASGIDVGEPRASISEL